MNKIDKKLKYKQKKKEQQKKLIKEKKEFARDKDNFKDLYVLLKDIGIIPPVIAEMTDEEK